MVRRKYFGLSFEKCNCLFYTWQKCQVPPSTEPFLSHFWMFYYIFLYSEVDFMPSPSEQQKFPVFFFNVPFICFVDKHTFNSNMFVIEVSHCYNRLYLYLMLLLATKSFKSVTNCSNGTFFS